MSAIHWHSAFFLLFALIACALAIAVVVSGNVVRMATYLVGALAAVGGLFFLAGAEFLGALQIMIYVGGTMVLLAFGVMLTAKGPLVKIGTGGGQWVMAVIAGAALLAVLLQAAYSLPGAVDPAEAATTANAAPRAADTSNQLGLGLLGVRVDRLDERDAVRRNGLAGYLLPFEIVSVHLLVVLIGAAYLARARWSRAAVAQPLVSAESARSETPASGRPAADHPAPTGERPTP